MPEPILTTAEFHHVVQKRIVNAAFETLADSKMEWRLIAPFLEAAREVCRGDFVDGGARIRLHTVQAEGEDWVDAEEAFLGIEVRDRDDGSPWLSETYWISDLATADDDPEQVRAVVRALERSIGKLNGWLAEREGDPAAP